MRLNEPLSGYGAASDQIRRSLIEHPHTLTNMIAENARAVRDADVQKKYAVRMYTELVSLSPEYRERMRESYSQRIGEIQKEIRSFKGPRPEGGKERIVSYDSGGRKTVYNIPLQSKIDVLA
ncbi:hypothetical protein CH373_09565 [Leptospira perolatii]|uniref:Uncharacterized protein n=1 Tax=Leptospira perolatii TaxID=2023191 RepID=A0A2M9ZMG5_9LEPT|nr:hypothetical protein [Leptospira perolatii]PJZ70037.1 hypothetical protein CH360_07310 [Leptospira perolatii]PJZ73225.1 hypothetical protein CH373_09565 [Leptospira perolatii]